MDVEQAAIDDLARSGLSADEADMAGMYVVDDAASLADNFKSLPALAIPYFDPISGEPMLGEDGEPFLRVRYLGPLPVKNNGFKKAKPQRYDQRADSGIRAYFPRVEGFTWQEIIDDPETPILITEGEKKALCACLTGLPTIGLGGVYNFMRGDSLLPEIAQFAAPGREFYICFDSDAAENPNIQAAEGRLSTELSLKLGAVVKLVRLETLKGQDKTGLDDFIVAKGDAEFIKQVDNAKRMRRIDSAVLSLNRSAAWIESEGLIVDLETNQFIKKGDFVSGSRFSSLEIQVPTQKGNGVKRVSVAAEWLTHPHAQRYGGVTFDPTRDDAVIKEEGRDKLNLWRGWEATAGDVSPFLELTDFLFSDLPEDHRDLPIKLMAYRAQNPGVKTPLALVLVGQQGCGKSMWAKIMRMAFAPHGVAIGSHALLSPFNGWLEQALLCVIDEAQALHLTKGADVLKSYISEVRQLFNEKYRPARQIASYCSFILTSNDRRVGAYSSDDRRMIVVSTPPKREDSFYDKVGAWIDAGGPKKVMAWLLDYDLKGWRPPKSAPMTAEKYLSYMESLTPVQKIAETMKTADQNVVKMWIDASLEWAKSAELDNRPGVAATAREVKSALTRMQIRPFYSSEELAMLFPAIAEQLHGARVGTTVAGEISRQLRDCGITYLRSADDPRGFKWRGMWRQYLIIADPTDWSAPITQNEFDRMMGQFPDYGMFCAMLDSDRKRVRKQHKAKE